MTDQHITDTDPLQGLDGARLIAAERQRQIDVEGWSTAHDETHGWGLLCRAAEAYERDDLNLWPWGFNWWKPKDALSNLIRAGALYQAAADLPTATSYAASSVTRCAGKIDGILDALRAVLDAHDATTGQQ